MDAGGDMSFKEASTRFMDVFGEEGMVVRPVGVKLIPKGKGVPEGAKAAEQGMPWCEAVRIAAMEDEAVTCWDWVCPSRYSSKWSRAWKSQRKASHIKYIPNKFKKNPKMIN
ncbi:MAG: hypothetical protein KAT65_10160 [Methanophagales archaeon]|nr:hypothetical protein [Methanophagales archaeon]